MGHKTVCETVLHYLRVNRVALNPKAPLLLPDFLNSLSNATILPGTKLLPLGLFSPLLHHFLHGEPGKLHPLELGVYILL